MVRPDLSGEISRMVFGDDEPNGLMTAEEWIRTYDDLDALVAACDDEDELWILARAVAEDALMNGYGDVDVDVDGILRILIQRKSCGTRIR